MTRATRCARPEAVHDLRVSIRRFSECLRAFQQFFPARRIRKRLKRIMDAAAEVRDRDIALESLAGIRIDAPEAAGAIATQRSEAEHELKRRLIAWNQGSLAHKWRAELDL
jgi:CHAD domain-containing protein